MERTESGLKEALGKIPSCASGSGRRSRVPGSGATLNQSLEKAGRVADFMEFAEVMCHDALASRRVVRRPLPCIEHTTEDGEAKRDDENYSHVSVWEFKGVGRRRRRSTRSPWYSKTFSSPRGATSK
jgi:succinate dehydrogenase / fumarate reductase, flavoprotein subunit